MDLIRELKDVRFQLDKRGYDCDAVDSFLAKVRADVADLESRQETAQQRVTALEEQVAGGESDNEGTLRRTLVLAQRLADETVADARKAANEMLAAATDEAEHTRQSSQDEADALLRVATADAATANQAAEDVLAEAEASALASIEASRVAAETRKADSIEEAARLLAEAETAGAARVAALEAAAQDEISRLRRPIRAEVDDLGAVRSALSADVVKLEQHLVDQRVRVRNAVEALRVGMSGSIEDLERIADDDELLEPAERPEVSGAEGSDVAEAPDIEIVDRVSELADASPTAQQLADEVDAAAIAERASGPVLSDVNDSAIEDDSAAHIESSEAADVADTENLANEADGPDEEEFANLDETEPIEHQASSGPATERIPVVEGDISEAEIASEQAPSEDATEEVSAGLIDDTPIDVFAEAGVDPDAGGDLVDLDATPGALFGTELTDEDSSVAEGILPVETDPAVADDSTDFGFLTALSEAIDTQPVGREG